MAYLIIVGLVLATGVLVTIEMALFSVRRERLELAISQGHPTARLALQYLDDPPKYLTASNVVLTAIGVVVGSLLQPWLTDPAEGILTAAGLQATWTAPVAYALAVTVLTAFTLVVGNLVPKHIGFVWAEGVVLRSARSMGWIVRMTLPLSGLVEPLVRLVTWALRVPPEAKANVEEGDLLILMEEGRRSGGIDQREQVIARRAFALSDLRVDNHMTPREQVSWLDVNLPADQAREKVARCSRSWILVGDGSLDRNVGVVQAREYLASSSPPDREGLLAMLKRAPEMKVGTPLLTALDLFRGSESRIIVVRDLQDRVAGVLTANDIVRAILGPLKSL